MATTRASQQLCPGDYAPGMAILAVIAGIFLLDLVATPLALLGPMPLKIAVDTVVGAQPLPPLLRALLPDPETHSKLLLLGVAAGLLVFVAFLTHLQALGSYVLRTHTGEWLTLISAPSCSACATLGLCFPRRAWDRRYDLPYPV